MVRLFDGLADRLPPLRRIIHLLAWTLVWVAAVRLAVLVHLAFLTFWPDHFIHEDSAAYLSEAQSILTGHYLDDPGRRPYGIAFFLALLSKLFSPNVLVFVGAQYVLSILTALIIAAVVRLAGAPRILALFAFLSASLYGRTIHYDNTIGAETVSVFLMALAVIIAAGLAFRKWPPILSALGIGLSLGAVMICRSAAVGSAAIILLWLFILLDFPWPRRLSIVVLAGAVATIVYLVPTGINWMIGKHPNGNETIAVMAFVVGYSADFDHGIHLDRKAQARKFVNEKRDTDTPFGWPDVVEYQWPFGAIVLMQRPTDSEADTAQFVRDIFIETVTTPSTLWRHLTKHFAREMYFLLFDANIVARRSPNPQAYEFFVHRDAYPFFKSPTGLQYRKLIYDHYRQPRLLSWLLPTPDRLQTRLDRLMTYGYSPTPDLAPLPCCGLTISSEYDDLPGPIRWYSASTLILLVLLIVSEIASRFGWFPALPRNLVSAGFLMVLLALINAAFPAFLIYGFNRYAYYVAPFLAGATALFGAVLYEWISRLLKALYLKMASQPRAAAG
jgi:hypothetical protein